MSRHIHFNSRPHGGRPKIPRAYVVHLSISTHALTEGDKQSRKKISGKRYFNSRPHGGRRFYDILCDESITFQLTPSRRATLRHDVRCLSPFPFQLTPSRRATFILLPQRKNKNISTHALTEGDRNDRYCICLHGISTHALTEGDHRTEEFSWSHLHFNSRPHGGRPRPAGVV